VPIRGQFMCRFANGFEYEGKTYKSLSGLAKKISGIHCSGFVFFKL
jgi:hypothetical protein